MVDSSKAVTLVVAIFVAAIMAAFLLPIALGAIAGPEVATVTLDTDETYEAQPGLNVTLDSVTEDTDADYTVDAGEDSETITVNEGENETVTVDGADVTVGAENITADSAETTVESPTSYGWGSAAGALWGILPVMIVLAIFLYFVYMAVKEL